MPPSHRPSIHCLTARAGDDKVLGGISGAGDGSDGTRVTLKGGSKGETDVGAGRVGGNVLSFH